MFDVIRVKLPGGVKRFPMFCVRDQLKFLLTSADMESKSPSEKQVMLDEILDIFYPGYSRTEQEHIFTKVYCGSFGKNAIKINIKSGKGKSSEAFMVITDYELTNEYKLSDELILGFRFPNERHIDDELFINCISYVIHNGNRIEWSALSEESKGDILGMVEISDIENIVKMLTQSCCVNVRNNSFHDLLTLFTILFSKAELNEFFKTNFLLNKHNIHVESVMNLTPMERSIYVALLAEELKKAAGTK